MEEVKVFDSKFEVYLMLFIASVLSFTVVISIYIVAATPGNFQMALLGLNGLWSFSSFIGMVFSKDD